jgi:hypothetical protein
MILVTFAIKNQNKKEEQTTNETQTTNEEQHITDETKEEQTNNETQTTNETQTNSETQTSSETQINSETQTTNETQTKQQKINKKQEIKTQDNELVEIDDENYTLNEEELLSTDDRKEISDNVTTFVFTYINQGDETLNTKLAKLKEITTKNLYKNISEFLTNREGKIKRNPQYDSLSMTNYKILKMECFTDGTLDVTVDITVQSYTPQKKKIGDPYSYKERLVLYRDNDIWKISQFDTILNKK